jgi:hypothetical protein
MVPCNPYGTGDSYRGGATHLCMSTAPQQDFRIMAVLGCNAVEKAGGLSLLQALKHNEVRAPRKRENSLYMVEVSDATYERARLCVISTYMFVARVGQNRACAPRPSLWNRGTISHSRVVKGASGDCPVEPYLPSAKGSCPLRPPLWNDQSWKVIGLN